MRETIVVTPDGVRAVAGDARRLAGELRQAAGALGGSACQVAAALAATPCGFDAMWLAWSTAFDQVAEALMRTWLCLACNAANAHEEALEHTTEDQLQP